MPCHTGTLIAAALALLPLAAGFTFAPKRSLRTSQWTRRGARAPHARVHMKLGEDEPVRDVHIRLVCV